MQVASNATLTVGPGARVTQANSCDVVVDGAVVLGPNAQWDTELYYADLTINGSWVGLAGSRLQVDRNAALTVHGSMSMTDGQGLKLNESGGCCSYDYPSGIRVYGSLALTNTPVSDNRPFFFYSVQPRDLWTFARTATSLPICAISAWMSVKRCSPRSRWMKLSPSVSPYRSPSKSSR